MSAALALAFAAGMVATVNPCGFAMLPAYLSYFMGLSGDEVSTTSALRSAFRVGAAMSLGFVAVFAIAGFTINLGFRSLTTWIPWLALAVGVAVIALGVGMLLGFTPSIPLPKAKRGTRDRNALAVLGFGVSYAVASLSCTLPVFLSVVTTQLASRSVVEGVLIFLAYGAGMSSVLLAVTIVLAFGKRSLLGRFRRASAHVNRVGGGIMVAAGAFIVWFWTIEMRSGAAALGASPAFQTVEQLSQTVLNAVADNTLVVVAGVAVLLAGAAVAVFAGRESSLSTSTRREKATAGADRE